MSYKVKKEDGSSYIEKHKIGITYLDIYNRIKEGYRGGLLRSRRI